MAKVDKFDSKKKEAYLENLRNGLSKGAAARAVGVSRMTVFNHIRKDPAFAQAVEEAEMAIVQVVEDAIYKSAIEGNVTAQMFILMNRAPDRWRDRRNVAVSGPDGGPIQIELSRAAKRIRDQLRQAQSASQEADPQAAG